MSILSCVFLPYRTEKRVHIFEGMNNSGKTAFFNHFKENIIGAWNCVSYEEDKHNDKYSSIKMKDKLLINYVEPGGLIPTSFINSIIGGEEVRVRDMNKLGDTIKINGTMLMTTNNKIRWDRQVEDLQEKTTFTEYNNKFSGGAGESPYKLLNDNENMNVLTGFLLLSKFYKTFSWHYEVTKEVDLNDFINFLILDFDIIVKLYNYYDKEGENTKDEYNENLNYIYGKYKQYCKKKLYTRKNLTLKHFRNEISNYFGIECTINKEKCVRFPHYTIKDFEEIRDSHITKKDEIQKALLKEKEFKENHKKSIISEIKEKETTTKNISETKDNSKLEVKDNQKTTTKTEVEIYDNVNETKLLELLYEVKGKKYFKTDNGISIPLTKDNLDEIKFTREDCINEKRQFAVHCEGVE